VTAQLDADPALVSMRRSETGAIVLIPTRLGPRRAVA
jgi:hypothetical protein